MKWQLFKDMWRPRTCFRTPSLLKEFEVQDIEFYLGWHWTSLYLLLHYKENEKPWFKKTEKNVFCLCVLLKPELKEKKKVLLMQSLRKTVQYCTKCISMHLWSWTITMQNIITITFLNCFSLRILTKCYFSTAIPVK